MEEKLYKIYYGESESDYIRRYLKESDIIDGYLSEAKAFEIFYDDMILCNNYLRNNYDNVNNITDDYEDEDGESYYPEEFQYFIISPEYDDEMTTKATKKMGNTLYYDFKNELYITGITDLGTSRRIVPTDIKVVKE